MSGRSATGPWRFELTAKAMRDLRRVDGPTRQRIFEALERLAEDPLSGDVRKIRGARSEWRLRMGDWRVRYERDDDRRTIWVVHVLPRERAYRD